MIPPSLDFRMPTLYHCHIPLSRKNRKGKVKKPLKRTFAVLVSPVRMGLTAAPPRPTETPRRRRRSAAPKGCPATYPPPFRMGVSFTAPPPLKSVFRQGPDTDFRGFHFPGPSRRGSSTVSQALEFRAHGWNKKEWKNPLAAPGSSALGSKTGIRKHQGPGFEVFLPFARMKHRGEKEKTPDLFDFRDGFLVVFMGATDAGETGKVLPDRIVKTNAVEGAKHIAHPGSSALPPADGGPERLDPSAVLGSGMQPPLFQEDQGFCPGNPPGKSPEGGFKIVSLPDRRQILNRFDFHL